MKKHALLIMAGVMAISTQAFAHVPPGGVVLDFTSGTTQPDGTSGLGSSVFPSFGQYYSEDGVNVFAIGFGTQPGFNNDVGNFSGGTAHIHSQDPDNNGDKVVELAGDSGGAAYQLADNDPFTISGMDVVGFQFNSNFPSMTFRGYTDATFSQWHDVILSEDSNGGLTVTDGGSPVLTETGPGYRGTHIHLDDVADFSELYLLEYFFNDANGNSYRGFNPNTTINILVDNVEIAPPAAVPVPAAVYLFGTALVGLIGAGRKRQSVA